MSVCAKAIQQPDGSFLLGLDPSVTNPSTCAYVVETGSESVFASLGTMTIEEAQTIAASVAVLWAIAWGVRQVANLLFSINPERSYDD